MVVHILAGRSSEPGNLLRKDTKHLPPGRRTRQTSLNSSFGSTRYWMPEESDTWSKL